MLKDGGNESHKEHQHISFMLPASLRSWYSSLPFLWGHKFLHLFQHFNVLLVFVMSGYKLKKELEVIFMFL
jgi:hypothetical protein